MRQWFYTPIARGCLFCLLLLSLVVSIWIRTPAAQAQETQEKRTQLNATERSMLRMYQDKYFSAWEKRICQTAGCPLTIEVLWETIAQPGMSETYKHDEFWAERYFLPLVAALKDVSHTAEHKKMLRDKLRRIVIFYNNNPLAGTKFDDTCKFGQGTLTINFSPLMDENINTICKQRSRYIQTALRAGLM
jgi:hypothetical protein